MRTIKLIISYDGTSYCGWQRQDNGPTIQEQIERGVSLICNSRTVVHGAGRTDAGVHAEGMVAHFHTRSKIPCSKLIKGLNSLLPGDIRITNSEEQSDDFHARYSARSKTYRYSIFTGPIQNPLKRLYVMNYQHDLSMSAMRSCLEVITGTHDFSSFETSGSRDKELLKGRGAVRTITMTEIQNPSPGRYDLFFTGDGFLRHMVRNLTGTILDVGRGKLDVVEFQTILSCLDRQQAGATAPAHGLTLLSVHY